MSARSQRIRAETILYGQTMGAPGQQQLVAGIYSFGIEMGLAIAVAAGPDAARVLAELRADVYHDSSDAGWVAKEMDELAAAIAAYSPGPN